MIACKIPLSLNSLPILYERNFQTLLCKIYKYKWKTSPSFVPTKLQIFIAINKDNTVYTRRKFWMKREIQYK